MKCNLTHLTPISYCKTVEANLTSYSLYICNIGGCEMPCKKKERIKRQTGIKTLDK